ncbi:alkaline phosphatase [Arthrobacter gengyunqii]|uniref:Alkaline phosphatase n=1 Tax=Arthrobacter gengyunqii TaxID=2886940 RepID=A0A9X1S642_9MICC|nr:alkaline phosphatase [Arthrobacter gengyunqii]MCC3269428.1 alkaline phosphatase [Arthrobacter gengyunqii]UOY97732.1 alkaline phosphatase [Arthrobacter gengyunqii]
MRYANAGKSTWAVTTAAIAALVLTGTGPVTGLQLPDHQPAATTVDGKDHGKGGGHGGPDEESPLARNVILMVGDGMGPGQREAIRLGLVGLTGELEMDSMPAAGRVHTHSADPETFVTDSAAAATAMSTGVKTYNGAIGVDLDQQPVTTALEVAEELGKSTGLVTTSNVTDATPAAFGSHVLDRDEQSFIARQFLESSQPEVILGGGEDYWYPAGDPGRHPDNPAEDPSEESAGTEGNLVELAQEIGYEYVWDLAGLQESESSMLLGLFANEEMFQYGDDVDARYQPTVPLTDMTAKALEVLSPADEGFFLMVEEEGIDAFSHVNNAELTIEAGIEFDRSVALAKDFAEQDGDTLLIVVGDHQTGGMTIESVDVPEPGEEPDESGDGPSAEDGPLPVANSEQQFMVDWSTGGHTALDVPLTAAGPGSELLTGVYENTRIFDIMVQMMRAGDEPGDDNGQGGGSTPPDWNNGRARFDLQAHRGGRGEYTEESLTGFAQALELGVSTLELDLHLSKDGKVVVWHDDTIAPEKCRDTAPAQPGDPQFPYVGARVADLTLAQLKTLDCGFQQLPGFPEQEVVQGNRMAELRDVYELADAYDARKIRFNVETKVEDGQAGGPGMEALTRAVVAEVEASGRARHTTIQSFDWSSLNLVKEIAPRLTLVALAGDNAELGVGQPGAAPQLGGIDIDDYDGSVARAAAAAGYDVLSPIATTVTAEMIRDAHEAGLPVIPWTVNSAADMNALIDAGVDGIITDYPTLLRSVMEERGMKLPRAYNLS